MVAAVSHEIKNPLGIVRSTAEVLGKRITKVAPGNEHLAGIIVDETSRLDSIVREFLDFARPKDLKLEMVSLNSLVDRAARFMQPEFESKSVELVRELDPQLPRIPLDPEQIYQVLLNIIINAIQAMPEGGIITIRTRATLRGDVEMDIADNGVGMAPEKIEQVFLPFFTDKNRGSGLGLAIAKNIINKHNGLITVVSRVGQGSTFTLTFNRTLP
jgi:signal transduction histidine kinase